MTTPLNGLEFIMSIRLTTLAIITAATLSACASVDLPDVDFMGQSDFEDEYSALEQGFASPDDAPDLPDDVRSAAEWDASAREMQSLSDQFYTPDLEPALSDDEFNRQFEAGQAKAEAYKKDDPS